jgi:quercetin 2,3-dioxygenase
MNTSATSSVKIINKEPLNFQWPTADPFLFCVYHHDKYPKSNGKFGPDASLAGRDIGQDFAGKDGWRMYHGQKIPGFPGHPHRGFETVTAVERGYVDHADSMGAAGRYANGDVQWMTAGAGVQHSEMFPLLDKNTNEDGSIDNSMELFQIWLNLPSKNKFAKPHFTMHWNEKIPVLNLKDESGKSTRLKIISGDYKGTKGQNPPPDSWAADPNNHVWIWVIDMEPGSKFSIPATESGLNRNLYYYGGEGANVGEQKLSSNYRHAFASDAEIEIQAGSNTNSKFLLLQGRPIAEPVVQYGPFVMNTQEEIQQAFQDYRATQFGGWPWESYDVVHTGKERFAKHADGKIDEPNMS